MMDPPLPPQAAAPKLRLMVSYGGHILPRANNKTLFYSGGDTRIISLPRAHLSLSSLFSHLSTSLLLNGGPYNSFSLKYQLPSHDLDSLISVTCHEDLLNMLDEYDRLSKVSPSSRIRFFLFQNKDDVVSGGGGGKCGGGVDEGWIVDAVKVAGSNVGNNNNNKEGNCNSNNNNNDSAETIVLESNSSFGSNSSSPNSPGNNNNNKGNGGCGGGGDDFKVVLPSLDSFGSDSSIPSPNFSQQAIVYQDASGFIDSKPSCVNLINTESVASDRSPRSEILSPVQTSNYMVSKPMDQLQQLFSPPPPPSPSAAPHYIHHPPAQPNYVTQYYPAPIPVGSYAPMYQTFIHPQQPIPQHHRPQPPYPVYMMPIGQSQNMYDAYVPHAVPHGLTSAPTVGTSQPQVHRPVMIASSMGYEGYEPIAPPPEYAAKLCRPTSGTPPSMPLPPLNHPTQPVAISPLENINCEFEDPIHAQIYKTQPSN